MLYAHLKNVNPTVIFKISFYERAYIKYILVSLSVLSQHYFGCTIIYLVQSLLLSISFVSNLFKIINMLGNNVSCSHIFVHTLDYSFKTYL